LLQLVSIVYQVSLVLLALLRRALFALQNITAQLELHLHSAQQDVCALQVHLVYLQMIHFVRLDFIVQETQLVKYPVQLEIGVLKDQVQTTVFLVLQDGLVKSNALAELYHVQVVLIPQRQV